MKAKEFNSRADQFPRLSAEVREACRLILVDGVMPAEAARQAGVTHGAITHAMKKITAPICAACGRFTG